MDEPSMLTPTQVAVESAPEESAASRAIATPRPRPRETEQTVYVAGFWHRFLAGMVDALLVVPFAVLLTLGARRLAGVSLPPARQTGIDYWLDLALAGEPALWGAFGLGVAIVSLYLFLFQALMGRTPGMQLLRLRVIDAYGDAPRPLRAGVRTIGYLISAATFSLGFVWIGFDREKRGLHDWLAGTYVTRLTPPRKYRQQVAKP